MPKLTVTEVQQFLHEQGHLLRIATTDSEGHPSVVPIWFINEGDDILFTPRGNSKFLHDIRRDSRVGLSIDEDPLPYRKVTVQGNARIIHELGHDDEWRDLYRQIAKRYIPDEAADAYVNDTNDQPRALIAVSLTDADARVTTWRMPIGDEDGSGIWHRRYYGDGTHMAELADSTRAENQPTQGETT